MLWTNTEITWKREIVWFSLFLWLTDCKITITGQGYDCSSRLGQLLQDAIFSTVLFDAFEFTKAYFLSPCLGILNINYIPCWQKTHNIPYQNLVHLQVQYACPLLRLIDRGPCSWVKSNYSSYASVRSIPDTPGWGLWGQKIICSTDPVL